MTTKFRSLGALGGAAAVLALAAAIGSAEAADPASCKEVNFADVGWTDITATTAATSVVLEGLGYAPEADVLSVPVTYASLKNGDHDVFPGHWKLGRAACRAGVCQCE